MFSNVDRLIEVMKQLEIRHRCLKTDGSAHRAFFSSDIFGRSRTDTNICASSTRGIQYG